MEVSFISQDKKAHCSPNLIPPLKGSTISQFLPPGE